MKVGDTISCNRCMKRNKNKLCIVKLYKKAKITKKNKCRKGWYIDSHTVKVTCRVEQKYLKPLTIHQWLELQMEKEAEYNKLYRCKCVDKNLSCPVKLIQQLNKTEGEVKGLINYGYCIVNRQL